MSVNLFDIEEDLKGKRESVKWFTSINPFLLVAQLRGELLGAEKH